MKQQIRLTEEELHFLVEDSVRNILRENGYDEGALWNAFKNKGREIGRNVAQSGEEFGRNMAQRGKQLAQGARNVGYNMANTYRTGRFNQQLQKQASKTLASVNDFVEVAGSLNNAELVNAGRKFQAQVQRILQNSQQNLQNVQNNTFNYRSQ